MASDGSPHQPYIGAVVAALEAEGFVCASWHADDNYPLDAGIDLERGDLSVRPIGLTWSEETGWACGPEGDNGALRWVEYMGHGVLPAPSDVAAWACRVARHGTRGLMTKPWFRHADADDDFVQQLLVAGDGS